MEKVQQSVRCAAKSMTGGFSIFSTSLNAVVEGTLKKIAVKHTATAGNWETTQPVRQAGAPLAHGLGRSAGASAKAMLGKVHAGD